MEVLDSTLKLGILRDILVSCIKYQEKTSLKSIGRHFPLNYQGLMICFCCFSDSVLITLCCVADDILHSSPPFGTG